MNQTAFQTNAFQLGPALAFQVEFDDAQRDVRPFRRERRKVFTSGVPLTLRMR